MLSTILLRRFGTLKPLCLKNQTTLLAIRNYTQFKPHSFTITFHRATRNVHIRSQSIFRLFKNTTPAEFKIKDKIPDPFALIYRNTMNNYLLMAQLISSGCLALVGTVVLLSGGPDDFNMKMETWKKATKAVKWEIYVYLSALLGMCVLLQVMVMRMPLRVYHLPKSNRYVFVYYSNLPFLQRQVRCVREEISKVPDGGFLPWSDSRYDVKNSPVIMTDTFFKTPYDLNVMIGVQKEIDDD